MSLLLNNIISYIKSSGATLLLFPACRNNSMRTVSRVSLANHTAQQIVTLWRARRVFAVFLIAAQSAGSKIARYRSGTCKGGRAPLHILKKMCQHEFRSQLPFLFLFFSFRCLTCYLLTILSFSSVLNMCDLAKQQSSKTSNHTFTTTSLIQQHIHDIILQTFN